MDDVMGPDETALEILWDGDVDGGTDYHYSKGELVVAEDDLARVKKKLWKRKLTFEDADTLDDFGLVLLAVGEADEGLPHVVRGMHETWDGSVPRVEPNHVLRVATHTQISAWPPRPTDASLPPLDARRAAARNVTVAVLDGGVDLANPWFEGRVVGDPQLPLVLDEDALPDHFGHGTFVAGVILQYAPSAQVISRRVVDRSGHVDDFRLAKAIREVAWVDVMVFSMAAYSRNDRGMLAVEQAIRCVVDRNPRLVLVAAAGNDGVSRPAFPAALKQVVGVGAVERFPQSGRWRRACFSNHGWWVDACAPGVNVLSTFIDYEGKIEGGSVLENCRDREEAYADDRVQHFDGRAIWSGTSFAAPAVAGVVAARMGQGDSAEEALSRAVFSPTLRRVPGLGALVTPYL